MKLIIQIPCFNEQDSLPSTLGALPKHIEGIDEIELLIIDDGSTDQTVAVARAHGVHHVISMKQNQGLARAFMAGLRAGVDCGADIIVNTDADNQYCADDIKKLVAPILSGKAEIVVGERPILETQHFSLTKKLLQRLGSFVVRVASRTSIPDAPSGFRAMSRQAAMQMNVFSEYTYTLETIIQAGQRGTAICSVPVRTNPQMRESRLVRSIASYVRKSMLTILRIFITYRPFRFFAVIGGLMFGVGFLVGLRFLYVYMVQGTAGHVQSLIFASLLMTMGFMTLVLGVIADLISVNRKLLEDLRFRLWQLQEQTKPSALHSSSSNAFKRVVGE